MYKVKLVNETRVDGEGTADACYVEVDTSGGTLTLSAAEAKALGTAIADAGEQASKCDNDAPSLG